MITSAWNRFVWLFFANDDDGYYGDEKWRAGRAKTFWLAVKWWLRNPAHNMTFYVIGFKGRAAGYSGFDTDCVGIGLGWTERDDGRRFPLLVLNPRGWIGYAGWRPNGAFGFKLRRRSQ